MKRQIFLSALVLLAAGCASNNEINEQFSQKEVTITASFAESQTRTIIADNGTDVYWEKGDEIKMFWGTGGSKFTSTLTKSAAVSDFEGTLPTIIGGTEGISAESKLMALYPYSSDATSDGKSITTTLPDVQDARAGSFAKKLNLSIAESNTFFMGFYNVCSGVCFKLATAGIKQVSIKSNKDEALAGKIKVAFEDGVPAVQDITEAKDSITLFPPTGSTFSTDVWYYIVTLPGTLTGGLTFTFKTDTQYATLTSTKTLELRRGIFGRVSGFDAKLTWKTGALIDDTETDKYVAVDMGYGIKWASYDLGATSPYEYGEKYAWGETETKSTFSWSNYKYCNGDEYSLTKYCNKAYYGYNGFTDNIFVLEPEDDAAQAQMGGKWRMPTYEEVSKLTNTNYFKQEWVMEDGVGGIRITSLKNGNSIFFLSPKGSSYKKWLTSSLSINGSTASDPRYPRSLCISGDSAFTSDAGRYSGYYIRAVCDE